MKMSSRTECESENMMGYQSGSWMGYDDVE